MPKDEYEMDKNMKLWECDNGRFYMAVKKSCVFCDHCDVFWDYTNGPYMFLCDEDYDIEQGMLGKCKMFNELKQEGVHNG